jgi:hypothetical protein
MRLATGLLAVALAAMPAIAAAQSASIALVTDVQGDVRLVRGQAAAPAGIPADVFADTRVEVSNGARVVMLMLASGEEATVRGPAVATLATGTIVADPSSAVSRQTSSVGNTRLRRRDLSQAAIVMRGNDQTVRFPLLSLAGTMTLETRPVFRWSPVEGSGPYRLVLSDESGRVLFAAHTESTQLELPSAVALVEGRTYTWEVSTRRANGLEYSNFGDFAIAPSALREQAARMRPADDAPFADRVAYAVWLDSVDLGDAARETWARLARERPGEERLRQLAGS